jgi:hypothetical protein
MLVVRVTENVRAVQSSYYSSCPCLAQRLSLSFFPRLSPLCLPAYPSKVGQGLFRSQAAAATISQSSLFLSKALLVVERIVYTHSHFFRRI